MKIVLPLLLLIFVVFPYIVFDFLILRQARRIKRYAIQRFGVDVRGRIVEFHKAPHRGDDECTVYRLSYVYTIEGKAIKRNEQFVLNTTHIDYAFHGELYGRKRIAYCTDDLERSLRVGESLDLRVLPFLPLLVINQYNEIFKEVVKT